MLCWFMSILFAICVDKNHLFSERSFWGEITILLTASRRLRSCSRSLARSMEERVCSPVGAPGAGPPTAPTGPADMRGGMTEGVLLGPTEPFPPTPCFFMSPLRELIYLVNKIELGSHVQFLKNRKLKKLILHCTKHCQ